MRKVLGPQTLAVTFLAIAALLVGACSPAQSPAGPTGDKGTQVDGPPKRGGTVTLNYASRWNADPALGQTPYTTWYYVGEPMIRRNAKTFELEPAVFESWQVSKDGMEIILKVRQGIKFHNKKPVSGREVEAKDLVYVLKSATGQQYPELSPVRFPRRESFGTMKDAVAVDKYTVKITLESPSVSFLNALADYRGTYVYPDGLREAFEGGIDSLTVSNPERHIGPGPFIHTKFTSDVESIYERNPDYYNKDKDGNQLPYVDRIRIVSLKDTATQQAAFVAGQIDILGITNAQTRNFVTSNRPDAQIISYEPPSCWNRVSLNVTKKPFDDYRVRRAMMLLMDHKKIGEVNFGDWEGKPLWRWPGPIPFVFPEARTQDELSKHPLYQGPTPTNIAEAKRLMKEAGYENGFSFDWHMGSGYKDAAQMVEANWRTHLGITPNLKVVDTETHRALATKGEYEAQFYCHIFDVTAVSHVAQAYHTTGGRNYGRFSDPKLDAILDEAERTLDLEPRKKLMRQAEDYILDHSLAMLPAYQNMGLVSLHPELRGVVYGPGTSAELSNPWWWRSK